MKLCELLFLVRCTALFVACTHCEMQRRRAEGGSLTDAHYDSALVLLARMDSLSMSRSDRMYLELLYLCQRFQIINDKNYESNYEEWNTLSVHKGCHL